MRQETRYRNSVQGTDDGTLWCCWQPQAITLLEFANNKMKNALF